MNHLLVTIGIPTYNRADSFLPHAIQSAHQQSYPNIEIIVSDNCSPDHTSQLVASFADPRIRYFRQDSTIHPEDNFNFCLDQAQGTYFLLLHDDDMIDQDFIATCLEASRFGTHFGLIRTGVRVIDEHGSTLRELHNSSLGDTLDAKLMAWFTDRSPWYFCNTLFNTDELRAVGGLRSKEKLLQDVFAVTKLSAHLPTLDIPDIKASYRHHSGEITSSVPVEAWIDDFLHLLVLMVELTENKATIRSQGRRFYALLSYRRARSVRSRRRRWMAYWLVYRKLGFRYPPPVRRVLVKKFKGFRSEVSERSRSEVSKRVRSNSANSQ